MSKAILFCIASAIAIVGCNRTTEAPAAGDRVIVESRGVGKADLPGSCSGACGAQSADGCWCDALCEGYGDCCADRAELCAVQPEPPSCEGACGAKASAGCWCDAQCAQYGDCCPDKVATCDAPPPEPSCAGYCGQKNPAGCWCNDFCEVYGDCCTDKKAVCDAPKDGQDCSDNTDCAPDLKCYGKPHDGSTDQGKCNSSQAPVGAGDNCSPSQPCNAGLVCAGSEVWGTGNCVPDWMSGTYATAVVVAIPDNGSAVQQAVIAYGLATVPVDIAVTLDIDHPQPQQLQITLIDPNGVPATVWNQVSTGQPNIKTRIVVTDNSGDDMVNGYWTLSITDPVAGHSGTLNAWTLELTSRWD